MKPYYTKTTHAYCIIFCLLLNCFVGRSLHLNLDNKCTDGVKWRVWPSEEALKWLQAEVVPEDIPLGVKNKSQEICR